VNPNKDKLIAPNRMANRKEFSILVADDNPVNVKLLEKALFKVGYRVITALNGSQTQKLASKHRPDLILLDIMMPKGDGFEVTRKLKKDAETASIPIIFLTGRNELDSKMLGFELGAVDYITKPFHVQEVLARIRLHLKLSLATNFLIENQAEKLRQIRDAQTSMLVLPDDEPEACFDVQFLSLLEAGGDFYDVLTISEDIYGYFVGDVSGHNIETSYITAAVKALLKQNCIPIYEPQESMQIINNVLFKILSDGKYMTACYARLNRKTKRMTIVSAGHPPAIYLPKGGKPRFIELSGDILGAFSDVSLEREELRVEKGDRFYLYTDGLIEKPGERIVWTKRLKRLLCACDQVKALPLQNSAEALTEIMIGNGFEAEDDVVVLVIEV